MKKIKNFLRKTAILLLIFVSGTFALSFTANEARADQPPINCTGATSYISGCLPLFVPCFRFGKNCDRLYCKNSASACGSVFCDTMGTNGGKPSNQCVYNNALFRAYVSGLNPSGAALVNKYPGNYMYKFPQTCKTDADCPSLFCGPAATPLGDYNGQCVFKPAVTAGSHSGEDYQSPYKPIMFTPQVTVPGSVFQQGASTSAGTLDKNTGMVSSDLMQKYIVAIYNYSMAIISILAAIMLMIGGLIWLTSEGNESKISQAKEFIGNSLAGMALALIAYILLYAVNPDLTQLKPLTFTNVNLIQFGCCQLSGSAQVMADKACTNAGGQWSEKGQVSIDQKTCTDTGCCVEKANVQNGEITNDMHVINCVTTPEEQCTKVTGEEGYLNGFQSSVQFLTGKCSDLPDCMGLMANCDSAADGDSCGPLCWCYNHKQVIDTGKKGESCGNNGASTCQDCHDLPGCADGSCCSYLSNCTNGDPGNGKAFSTWDWGGRSCDSPYDCCHH